jgi:hypothetical protein
VNPEDVDVHMNKEITMEMERAPQIASGVRLGSLLEVKLAVSSHKVCRLRTPLERKL